jgi:hypothetical protein
MAFDLMEKLRRKKNMKHLALIGLMLFSLSLVFALSCYDVQYTDIPGADGTYPSPYNGQTVTVEGIVTNNTYGTTSTYPTSTKFYISDPAGGPWSGLYIYVFGTGVQVGDFVTCTGAISEYYGFTEMIYGSGATVVINSSGNALPEPALIQTSVLSDPAVPANAEMWEGALCKFENVTVTAAPNNYQEFYVTDGSGPGQVDNACFLYGHSWSGVNVGSQWDRIVGIVDYSYNIYGLNPRTNDDLYTSSNEDNVVVLPDAKLIGNFPNPFAGQTAIAYNLKSVQPVQISVYNLKGQKVRTLVNEVRNAQLHNVTFDGRDDNGSLLPTGVYLYKMTAGNTVESRKLVIR